MGNVGMAAVTEPRVRWSRLPEEAYALVAQSANAVLLESSRFDLSNQRSCLFLNPIRILTANQLSEIPQLFVEIERAHQQGLYLAGYFSYECGAAFEKIRTATDRCVTEQSKQMPLAWFGVYAQPHIYDHLQGCFLSADPVADSQRDFVPSDHGGCCGENETTADQKQFELTADSVTLGIPQEEYTRRIHSIKERIAAGETYQVNFTDELSFQTQSTVAAVYQSLLRRQSVAYGAWINLGEPYGGQQILSFSPELFFRIENEDGRRKITTRPMKGTLPRGLDAAEDALAAERLRNDEKNRSEHVMIVDLLRNDLGRICETGSIRVEDIFSVERYQTLLQMTSTVSGTLRPEVAYAEIFRSLFPSGSVTGAPKIHTMQIIRELERKPRGVYTGSIGMSAPDGSSVFNVAIRTLVMKDGHVHMGIGGGIVADSNDIDEYRECQLKASFLTRTVPEFQLIETMLWATEFRLLSLHLERLESSADYFDFFFDREAVLEQLNEVAELFHPEKNYRVRLLLDRNGETSVEFSEFHADSASVSVTLSQVHTDSTDLFLRHKTTHRTMYNQQAAEARANGFDEVIFTNEKGEVTEGAISNLFIERGGKLLTPLLSCGVLPGVFRRHLLETRTDTEECILTVDDLKTADAIYLCNSLRGLRKVNEQGNQWSVIRGQ